MKKINIIDKLPESASMKMGRIAREKREKNIINLGIGDPHFNTPINIIDSAYNYMKEGKTHYENAQGIKRLRSVVSNYLNKRFKIKYESDDIIITPGAKQGVFYILSLLIEPGIRVGLFEPCWLGYIPAIKILGGVPIFCNLENNEFSEESLSEFSKRKIDVLILNNPTNPTGKVWNKKELSLLSNYCNKKNIKIVADEVYNEIVYEKKFISLARYKNIIDNLFLVGSFSKTLLMTGWRLGYLCIKDQKMKKRLIKLQGIIVTCPTSFSQYAIAETLKNSLEETNKIIKIYEKNRDILFKTLNGVGLKPVLPDGAFYMWVDVCEDGESFASRLINELGIIVVPGRDYGLKTQNYVRLSFGIPTEKIKEACRRFENGRK